MLTPAVGTGKRALSYEFCETLTSVTTTASRLGLDGERVLNQPVCFSQSRIKIRDNGKKKIEGLELWVVNENGIISI